MDRSPRNPHPELQLPLVDPEANPNSQPESQNSLDSRSSLTVRQNLLQDLQRRIFTSITFCIFSIVLSISKILISWAILSYDTSQCNQPIDSYFVCMIIHDTVNCTVVILRLATIISVYSGRELDQQDIEAAYHNPEYRGTQAPRSILSMTNLNNARLSRFKWRIRITNGLFMATNLYYCLLFLYAHYLYLQPNSDCFQLAPLKNKMLLAYLILSYIFVGVPTISFLVVCFCLPVLLFGFYMGSKKNVNPATKKAINSLPVTKYSTDLSGDNECSICMNEYTMEDNIVHLKCSMLHYFHEDCIKKWLSINKDCPICRQPIDKDPNQRDEVELPSLVIQDQPQEQQRTRSRPVFYGPP